MIVAHYSDYCAFKNLLDSVLEQLNADAKKRPSYYLNKGGVSFEKEVYQVITKRAKGSIFAGKIELISGQRFPDIVAYVNAQKAYGLEVKSTKSNAWKSIGSSIFEGTRVDNVKDIHLLFAKLSKPIEFRCRKYEDCLYDVAITHSPRYLIDMNTTENNSIFAKIGVEYHTLRQLDNPFKPIKQYFRKGLKTGEDLWWVDEHDGVRELSIKLWAHLSEAEKEKLRIAALAYFPILLSHKREKYTGLATWLVSKFGIVNHALRDTFTAGGQVAIQGIMLPKIYTYLVHDLDRIVSVVNTISEEDSIYYWRINSMTCKPVSEWKKQCLKHSKTHLSTQQYQLIKSHLLASS